ncbi:DUF3055 domain-containing protein [Bacillus pseudomycoides]|uniref:DUF3055 domain-containing protein n=1 Tax=Bacillus pseudomycoides TaxID=64104 RepID=A0A1S9X2M3_9BACI|nr:MULTISPECIES: DUF3055 domain-containing protein [Bacillus]EOP50519.1 hypothetical protein IIW_02720 [Bacillus cereus VD136]EOP66666.1 hypothetical protein KOW_01445 [Bacillus cereus VDM006]EOQ03194.1 hypothetical protein KOY_01044 [Bacillus cereus VDM021]OOG94675.1 hypothetical protein BTH41_00231 [Bacillus mycoides]AIK39375.1 hypothetical protein DJ92_1059 [Bacillus pseudomycoides]
MFEKLYDEHESVKVRFLGFMTHENRYDFGVIYTNMFFGKPLVVCMQTGRATLLGQDDVDNVQHLQQVFKLQSEEEADDLAQFFKFLVPPTSLHAEYEE